MITDKNRIDFTSVIRVPGGLLYRTMDSRWRRVKEAIHTVFVPLFDSVDNDLLVK